MPKKLSLDDLKVQSFVTAVNSEEASSIMGGTTQTLCLSIHTSCCDTVDSSCYTGYTDPDPVCGEPCGSGIGCTSGSVCTDLGCC